jgi:type III restriction enzyme
MFKLAPYQDDAVNSLVDAFRELLRTPHESTQVVFKSPTGSGKTIMAAELLKRLAFETLPQDYVYIWASMYKLHDQSRKKLQDYLSDSRYALIGIEEMTADALESNTILFTNWESVIKTNRDTGEWSNRAVKKGEDSRNIVDVLEATRKEGREVILIVDEAHQTYLGPKSQILVSTVIRPKLTLEVSATPLLSPSGEDVSDNKARIVKVPFQEVVNSGLIKQETRINYEIDSHLDEHSSDEAVVEAALERRLFLEKAYAEEGSDIKPLVLIQLPTEDSEKTSVLDTTVRTRVEDFLESKGIKYGNGRLAIWLSEETRNKERIDEYNSPVEVLIFKRAIATGWDCPRAQVLVMLQDMKSVTFKIQTVGRILRMPEAHHYTNPALNAAYVYTNLGSITVDQNDNDAPTFFHYKQAKIKSFVKNVELPSVYTHRTDFHDLTAEFRPILFKYLDAFFKTDSSDNVKTYYDKLDTVLDLYPEELQTPLLSDVTIQNLDAIDQDNVSTLKATIDSIYIEYLFRYVLKSWTSPYNFTRSIERLKPALYDWFGRAGYGSDKIDEIQRIIVCSEKNQQILSSIIQSAKVEFEDKRHESIALKRSITPLIFTIPAFDQYGEHYTMTPSDKHALEPYFAHDSRPKTEIYFENLLDKSNKIDWWYKNGEKMQHYFAVPFITENEKTGVLAPASFYPDYIVRFKDGSIGIYDTKAGMTVTSGDTKLKANALQQYIQEQNKTGTNLKGGIIDVQIDKNALLYCDDTDYASEDHSKWRAFAEI